MALLGEMHFKGEAIDSFVNLPRGGGIAYCAQEAWVQNATIRVRDHLDIYRCGTLRCRYVAGQHHIRSGV